MLKCLVGHSTATFILLLPQTKIDIVNRETVSKQINKDVMGPRKESEQQDS